MEKKLGEWTISKQMTERAAGLGRATREEIGMGESNNSPEIPHRGKTSETTGTERQNVDEQPE